jgi:hypothetical protein
MSEKQLLAKYLKERDQIRAATAKLDARASALDGVIASLRVVLGEVPAPKRSSSKATGTKALILDVLAAAQEPMRAADIATACKVKYSGGFTAHLGALMVSGDITRVGGGRGTRYRV